MKPTRQYDAIVVGGGHNGLCAAAVLARAGQRVLLLERREQPGGAASTEPLFPGYRVDTGAAEAGVFWRELEKRLALNDPPLEWLTSPAAATALQPDGPPLTLWRDRERSREEVARFSATDADRYPAFLERIAAMTALLRRIRTLTPPELRGTPLPTLLPWLSSALKLKRLGDREMMAVLRALPMGVEDYLDEWFETPLLKAALGSPGVHGLPLGPRSAGTFLNLLLQHLGGENGGYISAGRVRGGVGEISISLASAARKAGAEIRTGTAVAALLLDEREAACGVRLAGGEEIGAGMVLSAADIRQTLLEWVGAPNLPVSVVRKTSAIRFQGVTARLVLALRGLPAFRGVKDVERLGGHILICPTLEYLERASDAAKYGRISPKPYLDVMIPTLLDPSLAPEEHHLLTVTMQYAPYHLREGDWDDGRERLETVILDALEGYAPGLRELILERRLYTPVDWERDYGLPEGNIHHGQHALDQLLFMRPLPGYSRYRSPVENLFFAGAGSHPGGGVSGVNGYNAAREALRDRKKNR